MATNETFAERLTKLRENAGKKRQEVADDLEISRASLEYYEKGKRKPDIEVLAKIAEYYKVSTDYLLGLSIAPTTNKDIQFICDYTGLEKESIDNISTDNIQSKIINILSDKKGYYSNDSKTKTAELLLLFSETFISIYFGVLNDFLQSDNFLNIVTNCAYDELLEYIVCKIVDSDENIENTIELLDNDTHEYENFLLTHKSVVYNTFKNVLIDYEMLHKINLFDLQDNAISFAKTLTEFEKITDEQKTIIKEKVKELDRLMRKEEVQEIGKSLVEELRAIHTKGGD